jgi:uncharacterized surface protein with fasciclin (FAS1) repeats
VDRRTKQTAIATFVALALVAPAAYLALRAATDPQAETGPPSRSAATPSVSDSSPTDGPLGPSPNEAESPGGNADSATPGSEPTRSLCPFLPSGTDPGSPQDLVDETADAAIAAIPVLTVFASAVQATGMDDRLRKASGITILAPTDDAFLTDLTEEELDELILRRHDDLEALLEEHVIRRRRSLAQLVRARSAATLAGDVATFASPDGSVRISDDAEVTCSDINAANGTIHIIDSVLGREPAPPEVEVG